MRSSVVLAAAAQLVAELARETRGGGEPEQRLTVRYLGGIDLEQRQAGPVGLGRIVERPAVERPEPLQPIDPLAQRVGDGEQHLVRLGQLGGVVGPLVERQRHARDRRALRMTGCRQPLEPGDGRSRIGVGLRHLAVRGERRVDILEPRLLQVPDAQEQLLALLGVFLRDVSRGLGVWPAGASAGEIAAQRLDDAAPVLPRLGDAHQRAAGPIVGRLDVEDRRPGGGRGGQIGHALLFDLRDAQEQLDPLGGVGRAIGAGMEQLGQLGPGLRLRENRLERAVGLLVVADLRQDLLGGATGILGLEEPGGGDAQHPAQEPDPLLGVGRDGEARFVERRQRAPLVRFAGQPFEIGADVRVLGRSLERARAPLEGERLRAEPLFGDPARLGEELEPLGHPHAVARRRRAEQHLVGRQEARPLLRRPVERDQRQRRLAVARIRRQDPLVGFQRALGLIQLLLRERRHPFEQAGPRRHVGRPIGQRRQLIAQLAEGALLGVQRLEGGVVTRLRVDLAQRAGGAGVLGIERLDPLEDIDGGLGGGHPFVEQRPATFEQRQLGLGVPLGVLPLPLQDLHQRRPASLALVQRRQPAERPLVARLDRQHLVVEGDRLARVVEPLAREARHLPEARPPALRAAVRKLLAQQLDERPPGPRLGVEVLEPRAGLGVGRIGLEDLLEAGDGVLVLAELVGPQRGDPPVQRHARRRIGRRLRLSCQDLNEIAVATLRLVAPRQRRQRRRVIGPERQDVQVGRHHHDIEVQPIAVDGHDLQVTVDLLVDVRRRNRVEIVLQELEQRVPLLGRGVELAQRRHRLGQVGPQAQEALPDLDRLVGVLRALLRGARHLDPHRHAAVDIRLGLLRLRQHRQELRQLVPRGVVRPVELDHLAVGGIELADAAEERLRHVLLVEPVAEQQRQLGEQRDVLLPALGARRCLQHLGEVGPGPAGGQRGAHRLQRARLIGVGVERLLEVGECLGTAPELLAQLAGQDLGGGPLLAGLRALGPLAIERQQLVSPASLAQDPFEVGRRTAVAGVELEALAEMRLPFGARRPVLEIELRHRAVEAGGERGILGLLGLLQVAPRDRLPVGADQCHLRQRLGRRLVVGDRLQRQLHGGLTGLVAEQLVGEQATLFVQEVGAAGVAGREPELQIDQLETEIEVGVLAVPAAGVGQRRRERVGVDAGAVARVDGLEGLQGLRIIRAELQGGEGCRDGGGHGDGAPAKGEKRLSTIDPRLWGVQSRR